MTKAIPDFDLVAILVLALVLGIAQVPKVRFEFNRRELGGPNFRIVRVEPAVRTIPFFR